MQAFTHQSVNKNGFLYIKWRLINLFNALSIDKLNITCVDSNCTPCCLALRCCDNYYFKAKANPFLSFKRYHAPCELWILSKAHWSPLEKHLQPSVSFRSVSEQVRVLVENNITRPCNYVWIYNDCT